MTKTASHSYELTVRSYELDPYDHLNNGAYINFYEDAREQFIRTRGRTWMWYPQNLSLHFVVVNIDCDFMSPALAAERLKLTTRLARVGNKSVAFRQIIRRADDGLVRSRARVVMAFSGDEGRAVPIPEDFTDLFEVSDEGDLWTADEGGERA